jgi:hypothetical protein
MYNNLRPTNNRFLKQMAAKCSNRIPQSLINSIQIDDARLKRLFSATAPFRI